MDISSLDKFTQTKFLAVLKKDVSALTSSDLVFLKARRDYLTPAQQEKYFGTNPDQPHKLIVQMSYTELRAKAKELKLPFRVGMTKEELYKLVDDYYIL